jgi:HSP20 family molecular chaperone IbpA
MLLSLNDPFLFIDQLFSPYPYCRLEDAGGGYRMNLDMPGVKKEDLKVEVNGQKLTISAQRKGVRQGDFRRVFDLPTTVDSELISAKLEDGVLFLEIPKTPQIKTQARKNRLINLTSLWYINGMNQIARVSSVVRMISRSMSRLVGVCA